ncbi:MAG: hypothetical protein QW035_00465 [Candidatus Anstonellales archaeon]
MGKAKGNQKLLYSFIKSMENDGFYVRGKDIKLPSDEEYNKLFSENLNRLSKFLVIYYKIKHKFIKPTSSLLFPDNIIVFNRNKNGEKSNFFVFLKYSKKGIEVIFTDPLGPSQKNSEGITGNDLKPNEVLRRLVLSNFKSEEEMDKAIGEAISLIKEAASHKPEDVYYAQMHGHWGSTRGIPLIFLSVDDGDPITAKERNVIASMLLWHTDFDATGHHNHFLKALYDDVSAVEASFGITKVPSIEATLPLKLYDHKEINRFLNEVNKFKEELTESLLFNPCIRAKYSHEELTKAIDMINSGINKLGKDEKRKGDFSYCHSKEVEHILYLLPFVLDYNRDAPTLQKNIHTPAAHKRSSLDAVCIRCPDYL